MKLKKQDIIYVFLQFVLFGLYIIDVIEWKWRVSIGVEYIAVLIAILGIVVCFIAILQLNTNLSPFPTPKRGSSLIYNGVFKHVRHPIYGGILTGLSGIAIYVSSVHKLIIVLLLLILFFFKSEYEERQLVVTFPEYVVFKKTRGRFFPSWKAFFK